MTAETSNPVPDGYHTVQPFIVTRGASEVIQFLVDVFGAEELPEARTPDDDGLLLHAEVRIGDSIIQIADRKTDWPFTPGLTQVYVTDAEATLHKARNAGATVVTEVSDFVEDLEIARFRDPWGNLWWLFQRTGKPVEMDWSDPSTLEHLGYVKDTLLAQMRTLSHHG